MPDQVREVVVGLDNGGTAINATVLDRAGRFLVDRLVETPSRVGEGPAVAIEALSDALTGVLKLTGVPREAVRAVGLDTPGPASADGVISTRGAVNFADPAWRGFDVRGALEARLGLPVIYNNDANAASLYAHHVHFGPEATRRSSVALIVGTGLGGGVVETTPSFSDWFLATVSEHTDLRAEQRPLVTFALVPDLDMAGARGAALAGAGALGWPPPELRSS